MRSTLVVLILLVAGSCGAAGEDGAGPLRRDNVSVQLVADHTTVAPGGRVGLALRLVHDPHWHTYWRNPGDSGLATRLRWTLPTGASAGPIRWPAPRRLPLGPLVNFGYDGELLLPVAVEVPRDVAVGSRFDVGLDASWLICREECIPGDAQFSLSLGVAAQAVPDPDWFAPVSAAFAAEPTAQGWPARFSRVADQIVVSVDAPAAAALDAQSLSLFPVQPQVMASARGTVARTADGSLVIHNAISDAFVSLPTVLDLVLVDGEGARRRAFALQAVAGELPATAVAASDAAANAGPASLLLALLSALLGGVLLNLMPCVFPVLSLKALGLAQSGQDRAHARRHGLLYLAGVLLAFAALASLLLALRAAGEQLGWGFQLQLPWVVGTLALLLLAMGLSLSGLFQIGGAWMGVGESLASGHDGRSAFFTGVLAVIVASPCTAPFMGPALGFAVTQSAPVALSVFLALGLGLALPIVVLSLSPALAHRLPRPGAWMETFKQLMAFPLYLTAVWLLWVLGQQAGVDAIAQVLLGAVALAFALWLLGRPGGWWRRVLVGAGLAAAALSLIRLPADPAAAGTTVAPANAAWEPWSPERLAALRAKGRPVLVNMTAAWCITCLANERIALSSPAFKQRLERTGTAYLKGDWTHRDARITDYLAQFGRNGVPIYVLYAAAGGEPEVLPQLLTPDSVDAALTRAARR